MGDRKCGKSRKARRGAQAGARGRAKGSACGGAPGGTAGNQKPARDNVCHNCGKLDHWAKECRQPQCGQAHVAQVEEEEPALPLVHASIELSPVASAARLLHLDEPRAHSLLADGSSNDKTDGWCRVISSGIGRSDSSILMSREHTPSSPTAPATTRLTGGASTPTPPIT
jgi:hypothetical protein